MKIIIGFLIITGIYTAGFIMGMINTIEPKEPVKPSKPKLVMDSVCATPNGHPVYKYQDGNNTIYIVVRHLDGYPISMQVK